MVAEALLVMLRGVNINSGAELEDMVAINSSLNAVNYTLSERGNDQWVSFVIMNKSGESRLLEKKIKRFVRIKRNGAKNQKRLVIELDICIGRINKRVEVTLVDRSHFNYPMLIGRTFLQGSFVVDVDKSYTLQPECNF